MLNLIAGIIGSIPSHVINKYREAPKNENLIETQSQDELILDVIYNSQRDNRLKPSAACNITNVWMMFSHQLKANNISDDDLMAFLNTNIIERKIQQYKWSYGFRGLINSHKSEKIWKVLEWLCNIINNSDKDDLSLLFKNKKRNVAAIWTHIDSLLRIGKNFKFDYITLDNIKIKLDKIKQPIITGGKFTASGHFVIIIGYKINPDNSITYICHDPWGDATTRYKIKNGSYRYYSDDFLYNKLHHDGVKIKGERAFRTIARI